MKKLVLIFALSITSIISAQSKTILKNDFFKLLEAKSIVITKYEKELQKIIPVKKDKETVNQRSSESKQKNTDTKEEDHGFNKENINLEKTIEMFLKLYGKQGGSNSSQVTGELSKNKEYLKIMKAYDKEISEIEKEMYEVAKKYSNRK